MSPVSRLSPIPTGTANAVPLVVAPTALAAPAILPADAVLTPLIPPLRAIKLLLPESVLASAPTTDRLRIRWAYTLSIAAVHLLALLACLPWLFSWTGLAACLLGLYIFGTLGVNVCFHRLLTHRSFACSKRLERTLAILGVCCLQEGPARWVAIHRQHHQHSDERPDPHSPLVAFVWGHIGWLLVGNSKTDTMHLYHGYARDLMSQPFYMRMERSLNWMWVYIAHAAVIAAAALLIGRLLLPDWHAALQFAASIVVWGVLVRTVLVWHITWSVNSLSHLFGYQSHQTGENSRNNWFVALISNGEGWHNNHHHDQRSAAHGHKWYELDVSYLTILALKKFGLATKVMRHDR